MAAPAVLEAVIAVGRPCSPNAKVSILLDVWVCQMRNCRRFRTSGPAWSLSLRSVYADITLTLRDPPRPGPAQLPQHVEPATTKAGHVLKPRTCQSPSSPRFRHLEAFQPHRVWCQGRCSFPWAWRAAQPCSALQPTQRQTTKAPPRSKNTPNNPLRPLSPLSPLTQAAEAAEPAQAA